MSNTGKIVEIRPDGVVVIELDPDVPQGPHGGQIEGVIRMAPGGALRFNQNPPRIEIPEEQAEAEAEAAKHEGDNLARARRVREKAGNKAPA